ncbi:hypothetical protein HIM_02823 [Hirsutella minnesotensis 3608]|nr:hypothetical protein HIM_02823 [Hirsutella minnesotensis 3608]
MSWLPALRFEHIERLTIQACAQTRTNVTHFDITIVSDTVRPFGYLGKVRLDRAIVLYRKTVPGGSTATFAIRRHVFLLNQSAAAGSVPAQDVAASKFGAHRLPAKQARMAQLCAQESLHFTSAGRIGASRDSHLMAMFFERGGDFTSWDDLAAAALTVGIDRKEVLQWLQDGMSGGQADRETAEAKLLGLKGVPKFIINGAYEVDGAEDVSGFLQQL